MDDSGSINAKEFLPRGYVTDGSVSYTKELQSALDYAANKSLKLLMPDFTVMVSPKNTLHGGLNIPSNSKIIFQKNSKVIIEPNDLGGYELFSIRDASGIYIYGANLVGDKYSHIGKSGEWGMCLSIKGDCNSIHIENATITDAWGDGIYIGQVKDNRDSTPKNITINNTVIKDCRRQGMSVITVDGLYVNNMFVSGTKSIDSPFKLANGPHAGLDLEPNSFSCILKNIRIINLHGNDNDGGLFYVYLGSVFKNYDGNSLYDVDVSIDNLNDTDSLCGINLVGLSRKVKYIGSIKIENFVSRNNRTSAIRFLDWIALSPLPVYVNGKLLNVSAG
ncbi:hypothetical protein [Pectobacterium polaris]|uniref:hypothetical protein n=1 Tax=Pectobacterium polaris TaxID=2042057 RepID=UPI001CF2126B|nr:hypothetical protein [Pectobacterium polaris]MCA6954713.1 hypothetical protein [Pectobacterium polaris]